VCSGSGVRVCVGVWGPAKQMLPHKVSKQDTKAKQGVGQVRQGEVVAVFEVGMWVGCVRGACFMAAAKKGRGRIGSASHSCLFLNTRRGREGYCGGKGLYVVPYLLREFVSRKACWPVCLLFTKEKERGSATTTTTHPQQALYYLPWLWPCCLAGCFHCWPKAAQRKRNPSNVCSSALSKTSSPEANSSKHHIRLLLTPHPIHTHIPNHNHSTTHGIRCGGDPDVRDGRGRRRRGQGKRRRRGGREGGREGGRQAMGGTLTREHAV